MWDTATQVHRVQKDHAVAVAAYGCAGATGAAAAGGVPDDLYGEEVAAVIVLKDGAKVSEQEVIDFCKARLADYKCPKTVHFVHYIPKGPTGKLLKRELVRMLKGN